MYPYIIVYSIVILNLIFNKENNKYINFTVFVLFILFFALRNNVGNDWQFYEMYFNNIQKHGVILYNFEPGYYLLNIIGAYFIPNFRAFVIVISLIMGVFFWISSSKYSNNFGLLLLLSSFYIFYPSLEIMRQGLSLILFYYSLAYIEKQPKYFLIINLIGISIHYSAVITLIFYVFYKYKNVRIYLTIFLFSFFLFEPLIQNIIKFFPIIWSKYQFYFVYNKNTHSIITFKLLELVILSIIGIYLKAVKNNSFMLKIGLNLTLMDLLLFITLSPYTNIVYRIMYYTNIGIIFIYLYIYKLTPSKKYQVIYKILIIMYITLRFVRLFPFLNSNYNYYLF